jgi:CheY-like chemotaxis protein
MLAPTDYEITEAENGEQALAAIAKQRPDLILMDIQLPIVDGYTAVSRIVHSPANRDRLSWIGNFRVAEAPLRNACSIAVKHLHAINPETGHHFVDLR